jgi:hypothetical protein
MKSRTTVILLLAIALTALISCGSNSGQVRKKDIIPEKKLISLLIDLYIGDGLLQNPSVRNIYVYKDSNSSYLDIIQKHGFTKDKVDKTLEYYFENDPRELQKIYDEVLARLSEIQTRILTEKNTARNENIWEQRPTFVLPEEGARNTIYFYVAISDTGWYSLTFTATIFKDDKNIKPRTSVAFVKTDSIGKQVSIPWSKCELVKDDLAHTYVVTGRVSDKSFWHISGFLYDCDNQKGAQEKHAKFTDIKLLKGLPE